MYPSNKATRSIYYFIFLSFLGTNVDEAKRILSESNMPIQTADNLDEAALKAVAAV